MESRDKLMIPGPVEVDERVLEAMGSPVRPHYGTAWTAFYKDTLDLIRGVFKTSGDVFLMPGSGTVAIDACLAAPFRMERKSWLGPMDFSETGWY
jgi:alanine-glyoxylate transaminase/serine-glyoxylate transaminase/serine-pyruvate transaminase